MPVIAEPYYFSPFVTPATNGHTLKFVPCGSGSTAKYSVALAFVVTAML